MRVEPMQKSYDLKTFLNKEKTKDRIFVFSLNRKVPGFALALISVIAILFCLINEFSHYEVLAKVMEKGVECTLPFFNDDKKVSKDAFKICIKLSGNLFYIKEPKAKKSQKPIEIPKSNIKEESYRSNGIEIKNETSYSVDPILVLQEGIQINTPNPKVLIVHTHGSESYTPSQKYPYTHSGNFRTSDTNYNMIRVGEELKKALESKGVCVIHDKTINDYPSYNDSYNKAGEVIKRHLSKDNDIAFVFDIHRDAVGDEKSIIKFVSEIKGKPTAQVMMVCGTDTNLENPNWQENFKLSVHIQNYFNINYPGFLRPINLRKERFNMHLTKGSLLFEIGTNGNTMEEALRGAKVLGEGLGDFINNLK